MARLNERLKENRMISVRLNKNMVVGGEGYHKGDLVTMTEENALWLCRPSPRCPEGRITPADKKAQAQLDELRRGKT